MKPSQPLSEPIAREASSGDMSETNPADPLYALIAKQSFFVGLNAQQLRLLADSAVLLQFEPERYVFRQGAPANRFYLILEGKVELEMESEIREDTVIPIRTLGPGEDLGWDWLFPPFYFHASARTIEATKAISFYGTRLQQQCEEDHDVGYEIMKRIAAVAVQSFGTLQQKLMECESVKTRI
jgi:CRP/FNR family cyclic AMP-dependent transcriptional regulator